MVWLNANYDRNASTRAPALAQLYHVSELTTHTHTHTHTQAKQARLCITGDGIRHCRQHPDKTLKHNKNVNM